MKRVIFSWLPLLVLVATSVSCSVMRSSSEQREMNVRAYEPVNYVPFTQPLAAEIKVLTEQRVSDTWVFTSQVSKKESASRKYSKSQAYDLKVEALAKSAAKHNADMIVAASFDYKRIVSVKEGNGSEEITIIVSGYPARFVNWRSVEIDSKDYDWITDFYGKKIGLSPKVQEVSSEKVVMAATPSEVTLVVSDK